jgi:hypothetical protein
MAIVHPQKIIQGLEENKIEERKIAIFVELKPSFGGSFKSNKLLVNLSNIESYNRDENQISQN